MTAELTIQQVAIQTGLSEHTLRYYERVGLITPITRAANGHRRYSERDLAWIKFLIRLRTTDMPLHEMQQFAELRQQGEGTIKQRRHLLELQRDRVQAQLAKIEDTLVTLERKIEYYQDLEADQQETD